MSPPQPIQGTIGSRIRVIFGANGYEWLLLLEHDDGRSSWQSKSWKDIPSGLSKQINECDAKGRYIKYADFGPENSWFVYDEKADGTDGHRWWGGLEIDLSDQIEQTEPARKVALGSQYSRQSVCIVDDRLGYQSKNIPDELFERLIETRSRRGNVDMLRLFSDGQYYIRYDRGTEWEVLNDHLDEELQQDQKEEDLAVAGDGSWIIIRAHCIVCSTDVDTELEQKIKGFFRQQSERNQKRQREIDEYHARSREANDAVARGRREAAEQAAREEEERAKRVAEAELRAKTLELQLIEKIHQEKESIDKLEINLEAMQSHLSTMQDNLYSRKKSLQELVMTLPPAQRPEWNLLGEDMPSKQEKPQCVICQDKKPARAIIPCGHVCLCDDCEPSISQGPSDQRLCPICRGPASCTLRIYM